MADEIINRVANSSIITINLEDYYPQGERVVLDLKDWLFEGFVLREKEFRTAVKSYDWSKYSNCYVAISCSTDAIIPAWATMLLSMHLEPYAKLVVEGSLELIETILYSEIIANLDLSIYQNKPIIIKGCSNKPVPSNAYLMLSKKLKPVARSIMYGEACSAVPLHKRK